MSLLFLLQRAKLKIIAGKTLIYFLFYISKLIKMFEKKTSLKDLVTDLNF